MEPASYLERWLSALAGNLEVGVEQIKKKSWNWQPKLNWTSWTLVVG